MYACVTPKALRKSLEAAYVTPGVQNSMKCKRACGKGRTLTMAEVMIPRQPSLPSTYFCKSWGPIKAHHVTMILMFLFLFVKIVYHQSRNKMKQTKTYKNWLFKPECHGWKAYVRRGSADRSLCLGLWVTMALPNGTTGCDKTDLQGFGVCKDQRICVRYSKTRNNNTDHICKFQGALNYDSLNFVFALFSLHPLKTSHL